jgi:hypothetical protein
MKNQTLISFFLVTIVFQFSFSQIQDTIGHTDQILANDSITVPTLPDIFSTDKNLIIISQYLPSQWYVTLSEDTLRFISSSAMYRFTEAELLDTAKKGRSKLKDMPPKQPEFAIITFRLEPVWPGEKVEDAQLQNSHTQALINHLLKKYKISHLADYINDENFDIQSPTLKENERKSILRYFEEKEKLTGELIQMPIYHTSDFSYFLIEIFPVEEERKYYSPHGIVVEMDSIFELFDKYAGK